MILQWENALSTMKKSVFLIIYGGDILFLSLDKALSIIMIIIINQLSTKSIKNTSTTKHAA